MPWWWWPIGLAIASLFAAEVHLGQPGVRAWLPYLFTVPLAVTALVWLGRHRVRVTGGVLWVGPAHLPLRHVDAVEVVQAVDKRQAMGPGLDPAAFVMHRAWVGPMVRVELLDTADPTPYWLFSTRRPDELAAVLREQAGAANGDAHPPGR